MKSVLISIRPEWCEKIANGQKTMEIRKNKPKIKTPFKCYIYCTKGGGTLLLNKNRAVAYYPMADWKKSIIIGSPASIENGKVIGEFICDAIISHCEMANADIAEQQGCISREDLLEYAGGKELYGWHISNLVIYDTPKELSDFRKPCIMPEMPYCPKCPVGYEYISETEAEFYRADGECNTEWRCLNYVTRPPQSWCYVEEVTH